MNRFTGVHIAAFVLALACVPALAASLGPTSEERPPVACDPGWFVTSVKCTGSYCDNIAIECGRVPNAALGQAGWTRFVSEEGGGRVSCPAGQYIAGLACNGRYCDNLSLYCVEALNVSASNCRMTRKVSEESGRKLYLGEGIVDAAGQRIAARSLQCTGRYCDNKAFEVCEVAVR